MKQLAIVSASAALVSSLLLLVQDVIPAQTELVRHTWLAGSALLLAGTACIGLASAVRARLKDLIMRLCLGTAFILWGMQQLLHESAITVVLGDIVIILFIVDLSAMIGTHMTNSDSGG